MTKGEESLAVYEIIKEWPSGDEVGYRIVQRAYQIGERPRRSRVYEDGELTGEELLGVSAIDSRLSLDFIAGIAPQYPGDWIVLLEGLFIAYGEDDGEVILDDAEVKDCVRFRVRWSPDDEKPE